MSRKGGASSIKTPPVRASHGVARDHDGPVLGGVASPPAGDSVRQEFSVCLLARPTGGTLRASDESFEVAWFAPEDTDRLPMVPSIRKRLDDWRAGNGPVVR